MHCKLCILYSPPSLQWEGSHERPYTLDCPAPALVHIEDMLHTPPDALLYSHASVTLHPSSEE